MATPNTIKVTQFSGSLENAELNYSGLYLQQVISGPNANQATMLAKDATTGLGETAVSNWPIYDGAGQEANLVARAQGLHTYAGGSWYNSFIIAFEIERFKGSTLHVTGPSVDTSDWAIVGGTGEFELARGVIKREPQGLTQLLTINAFYRGKNVPTLKSLGPWGGSGGVARDTEVKPWRLESITIQSGIIGIIGIAINSISFTYKDKDGNTRNSGQWGVTVLGITNSTINLGPTEVVTHVSGTYNDLVTSLKLVTNLKTYGPYGAARGTSFEAPMPEDNVVVGFFGRSGSYLDQIGVYAM